MKWRTFEIQRAPGFRFNLLDLGFILFLAAVAGACRILLPGSSFFWIPLYLAMSFFLFCNVFRIGNRLESFWYIPFTLIAGYGLYTMDMTTFWVATLFFLEPLKWGLIGYRIRKGSYIGLMYKKFSTSQQIPRNH